MVQKKTICDLDVAGKKVLLRCDLDVPREKTAPELACDVRLAAALPTIRSLLERGAAVIACAHRGDPRGGRDEALSLAPAAECLGTLLGRPVLFAEDAAGEDARAKAAALRCGQVLLLENLRFHPEEERNDPGFAKRLASMAEIYVLDSFAAVYCAHASTVGAAALLPAAAGLALAGELEGLGRAMDGMKRPFVAVLGGAPDGKKLDVMDALLDRADAVILGGGLANTFLKARGGKIGRSLFSPERCETALALLDKAKKRGVKCFFPIDTLAANEISPSVKPSLEGAMALFGDKIGMDIGPRTVELFGNVIRTAGAVVWSGPMGVWELPAFSGGTRGIGEAMAAANAVTVVAGGDSVRAVEQMGLTGRFTHVSPSAEALLRCLAGQKAPGLACLPDR